MAITSYYFTIFSHLAIGIHSSEALYCEGPPSAGCTNGLWNEKECKCECITPYCTDIFGACASIGTCGTPQNPWSECTKGVDCPWWTNPLRAESCTTGPQVPPGIWDIFNTVEECCRINFPYSNVCVPKDLTPSTPAPTPYPTIGVPELPDTQIIPVRFAAIQLPLDIDIEEFRGTMRDILKTVLLNLAEAYRTLKVLNVEERDTRRELKYNLVSERAVEEGTHRGDETKSRSLNESSFVLNRMLQRDPIDLEYDITIVRQEGIDFRNIIYNEIEDNRDYIMESIRSWNSSLGQSFDICILKSGEDNSVCTEEDNDLTMTLSDPPTPSPVRSPTRAPTDFPTSGATVTTVKDKSTTFTTEEVQVSVKSDSNEDEDSSLPVWIIILIVLCILLILCCCSGLAMYMCFKKQDSETNVKNIVNVETKTASRDIDEDSESDSDSEESSVDEERAPKQPQQPTTDRRMVMRPDYYPPQAYYVAPPHGYQSSVADDNYTEASSKPDPSMYSAVPRSARSGGHRSKGKEPTLCIDYGGGIDPAGNDGASHYSRIDPSVYSQSTASCFQLEPSVYYGGSSARDPSVYHPVVIGDDPSVISYSREPSYYTTASRYSRDVMMSGIPEEEGSGDMIYTQYPHLSPEDQSEEGTKQTETKNKPKKKAKKKKKQSNKNNLSKSTTSSQMSSPSTATKENPLYQAMMANMKR